MSGTLLFLQIAGYVGLLLWGTHMVTTGVLRGYGSDLRLWLGRNINSRPRAFLVGLGITSLLQSSTATGLMATSFAASGIIGLEPALVVMLGANVGTTLIVQILSFNVTAVAPVLIFAGVIAFRVRQDSHFKNLARISIGLGLMLLALGLLVHTLSDLEVGPAFRTMMAGLSGQPALAILVAALLTWACHSSVAIVLLIVSLATTNVVSLDTALALVLGANFGATIPPFVEAGSRQARRLPFGNMLVRATGCVAVFPLLPWVVMALSRIEPDPARLVVNFHTAFNVALALLFIAPIGQLAALLIRLFPDPPPQPDPGAPQYLDEAALDTANVALANASREALRMADMAGQMLKAMRKVFHHNSRKDASKIIRMDRALDRLSMALRGYLADINREALNDDDAERSQEILTFAINIEHVGDILATNMVELALKQINLRQSLSQLELLDIDTMHAAVMDGLQLAVTVLLGNDTMAAQQLAHRKVMLRRLESEATEAHFARMRDKPAARAEAGDTYLRILRDLRRIHSHIAALAYPVLEHAGLLPK